MFLPFFRRCIQPGEVPDENRRTIMFTADAIRFGVRNVPTLPYISNYAAITEIIAEFLIIIVNSTTTKLFSLALKLIQVFEFGRIIFKHDL